MSNLCIIPARGGSKRIPRKNIKDFLGKPIIEYSITSALKSNLFDEVMVSTEDQEIAAIAKKIGANVPFMRSQKNANDFASTIDVLIEVVRKYKSLGREFKYVCCIYPTAVFTTEEKLKNAYSKLHTENLESVFLMMPFSYPIQRAFKFENNKLNFLFPEYENSRSQDVNEIYHDAGQFYFLNSMALLENKTMFPSSCSGLLISEIEAQDIDNEVDWKIAEMKYIELNRK